MNKKEYPTSPLSTDEYPAIQGLALLPYPTWISNPHTLEILWANQQALDLWQAESIQELFSRDRSDTSQAARKLLDQMYAQIKRGEIHRSTRTLFPKGKPVSIYFQVTAFPMKHGDTYFLTTAIDTDQIKDKNSLRRATSVEYAPISLSIHDLNGNTLTANTHAVQSFGANFRLQDMFSSKGEFASFTKQLKEQNDCVLEQDIQIGQTTHTMELHARAFPDPNSGDTILFVGFVDITDRLEAERLIATNEALQRLNQELESFAYIASHDLRSPLNNLNGLLSCLEEEIEEKNEYIEETFALVTKQINKMKQLLGDLLKYARLGQNEGEQTTFDLREFVRDVCGELAIPSGFSISFDLPDIELTTYQPPLHQILRNAITNAFTHHNDPAHGHLTITARPKDGMMHWQIQDDGPGLSPDRHEAAFQMFRTFQSGKKKGTGIGLPVIKKVVKNHGGTCWLESVPGEGLTLHFTWPL